MIRIKVKALAIAVLTIVLSGIAIYAAAPAVLYKMEKYDALLAYFPRSAQVPDALYWAAETTVPQLNEEDLLYIYPRSVSYSSFSTNSSPSEEQLIYSQQLLEKLLELAPEYRHREMAEWKLAQIYLIRKEWEQAEALMRRIASNNTVEGDYRSQEAGYYLRMLESRRVKPNEVPMLTGKVLIGDKPAVNAYVVLQRKEDNSWISPPLGHYPAAMTDQDGVYRFYDVPADTYVAGAGLSSEAVNGFYLTDPLQDAVVIERGRTAHYDIQFVPQVKVVSPVNQEVLQEDHIVFRWEPYPGASYYQISITAIERGQNGEVTGTSQTLLEEQHAAVTAQYSTQQLRTSVRGFGKSGTKDSVSLSTQAVLGAVYPGGQFVWSVDAYDAAGRRLSSSSGYYTAFNNATPFFAIDEKGMLAGDKLVLQGQYEEALLAYEEEQDSPYAWRAAAMLHFMGWRSLDDAGDKAKALEYLLRIENPTRADYEWMAQAYEALGDKAKAEEARQRLSAHTR